MHRLRLFLVGSAALFVASISSAQNEQTESVRVASHDNQLVLTLSSGPAQAEPNAPPREHPAEGLRYSIQFHGKPLIDESPLGLKLEGTQPAIGPAMRLVHQEQSSADETYTIPVGKSNSVRDHYNAKRVGFEEKPGRKLTVEVRAYDDGVAFRYILPAQEGVATANIERELTEFHFSKDAITYPLILDGYQSSYEDEYQVRQVS